MRCSGDKESIKEPDCQTDEKKIPRVKTWSKFLGSVLPSLFIYFKQKKKLNWNMTSESQKTRGNCGDGLRRVRAWNPKRGRAQGKRG